MVYKSVPKIKLKKSKIKLKKHPKKRAFGGTNSEILYQSLNLLITELLPLAVDNYAEDSRQGNAYAVTNIISEIRGVISQLESSIDSNSIISLVNQSVAASLRVLISSFANHLFVIKQTLPLKINDTGTRREIQIILDSILKEFEKTVSETVHDIDNRVSKAVNDAVKGKARKK